MPCSNGPRWSVTTDAMSDGAYPVQKVTYRGTPPKESTAIYPYGFAAKAPAGTLSPVFFIDGETGKKIHLPISVLDRPDLEDGEVAVFHPGTGTSIIFKDSSDLDIDAGSGNVNLTCATADVTATTAINTTAPLWTHNGNFTLNGNYSSVGTMTNNAINVSGSHFHETQSGTPGPYTSIPV